MIRCGGEKVSTSTTVLWPLGPHTKAKHEILHRYLGAWFGILGRDTPRIIYIDGFCGPGRYSEGEKGSPLIALDQAIKHAGNYPRTEFVFIFVDKEKKYIKHLNSEILQLDLPNNIKIDLRNEEFKIVLSETLKDFQTNRNRFGPTFAFVDPFGFSGIPFNLIGSLLQHKKTEIFINIMADSINRFVDHPDQTIPKHIIDTFGTDKVVDVIKNAPNRNQALRDLYQQQLKIFAKFVRFFEMRDKANRIIYYLFFASNNRWGHIKMKEAFWKVDDQTGFVFSDATNPDQPVLFSIDHPQELANLITENFKGQTVITDKIIHDFVEDQTPYTCSHAKRALQLLESENKIVAQPIKQNGQPRVKRSFPDGVIVEFGI